MRKLRMMVFLSVFIIGNAHAWGATELPAAGFDLGPELYYYSYEEPGLMESSGLFKGVSASYSRRGPLFLRMEGRYAYGEVDYSSERTGSDENIPDNVFEARALIGSDQTSSTGSVTTLYMGLAYRYLNDNSGGRVTTTGHYGYERESNYYYLPIGIKMTSMNSGGWSQGFTLEYDHFIKGEQRSHLTDVNSSYYYDVTNEQDEGYGWRVSLRFRQVRAGKGDLTVAPFIRSWRIEDSDLSVFNTDGDLGLEPKNKTQEIGVTITWQLF